MGLFQALPGEVLLAEAVSAQVVAEVQYGSNEGEQRHCEEQSRHSQYSCHTTIHYDAGQRVQQQ